VAVWVGILSSTEQLTTGAVSGALTEAHMNFDKEFDASGLACPLPIVKTKKSLQTMTSGQVLRVIATDPGSVCDMEAFAEQTGNALLYSGTENSKFVFLLKKA